MRAASGIVQTRSQDWLCIDQLREFTLTLEREVSEADIRTIWEYLVQARCVKTRHRQTGEWADPASDRIPLQDYLVERQGICALPDNPNSHVRVNRLDDPALQALLREWIAVLAS